MPPGRRPLSPRARAVAWLAQRDHSEAELRRKLARHLAATEAARGGPAADSAAADSTAADSTSADNVAADLDAHLAEERPPCAGAPTYAAPGAHSASAPASTDRVIDDVIAWLRERGYLDDARFVESRVHLRAARHGNLRIRQELAQHGVALPAPVAQALKESEPERAAAVWRRKFDRPAANAAERARQSRFLAQRGFSAAVIARLLRRADDDESEAEPPPSDD